MAAWFDEHAHAGPEHLDADYAAAYDRKARTDVTADIRTLRELGLAPGTTLVDLGCGTAALALAAASYCDRVVAVDVSTAMLDAARAKDPPPNVELVQGGFLTYEHGGASPDFVYSRNALHHLPDLWKALALTRLKELLAPRGFIVLRDFFFSFGPEEADDAIHRWLDQAPDDPAEGWTRPELLAHLRTEFSTFTWLLDPMIQRAGLRVVSAEPSESGIYARYVLSH